MKLKEAEKYYELGLVDGLDAVYLESQDAWVLEIVLDDAVPDHSRVQRLENALGALKCFKSLDTLSKDADRIRGHKITRMALDQMSITLPEQMELANG